jgi:hypothetical protein
MGEEKAPGRIQLVSVGMSTVGTAPGGDVTHSVPFTGVYYSDTPGSLNVSGRHPAVRKTGYACLVRLSAVLGIS